MIVNKTTNEEQTQKLEADDSTSNVIQLVEELDARNFFESGSGKGRFLPKKLGDIILKQNHFRFAAETLWVYRDGVYRPDGLKIAKRNAIHLLGYDYSPSRVKQTLEYLKDTTDMEIPPPSVDFINLLNGRYNVKESRLEVHNPKIFETCQLPVRFDPEAKCPEFDKYLSSTFDDEMVPLIEELLGFVLVPDTRFEKAFLLYGSGANGKSVLLEIMIAMLGRENISSVPIHDLDNNRFKVAELLGKLANIFPDISDKDLAATGTFKGLVSGELLTAERKFEQQFQFNNTARLIFSCNRIPHSKDTSDGYFRRWIIIPFTRQFKGSDADKDLKRKLTADHELSGILNRALNGLNRLHTNMKFTEPPLTQEAKAQYYRESNSLSVFIQESVDIHPDKKVFKQDFYKAYGNWCWRYGISPISEKSLYSALPEGWPGIEGKRSNNRAPNFWKGLDLKESATSTSKSSQSIAEKH